MTAQMYKNQSSLYHSQNCIWATVEKIAVIFDKLLRYNIKEKKKENVMKYIWVFIKENNKIWLTWNSSLWNW